MLRLLRGTPVQPRKHVHIQDIFNTLHEKMGKGFDIANIKLLKLHGTQIGCVSVVALKLDIWK